MIRNIKKGFTLIELLIVVAIIGILAALLMANFVGVRQRARDAQRKSDLRQIRAALELYRADVGSYPGTVTFSTCGANVSLVNGTTTYMTSIPCDPLTVAAYSYTSSSSTTYTIITCLENANDTQKDNPNTAPCNGTSNYSFTLKNP